MGAFFTAILAKFAALASWLGSLVVAAFAAFWLLGTDLVCWVFESVLKLTGTLLNGLPGHFSAWASVFVCSWSCWGVVSK